MAASLLGSVSPNVRGPGTISARPPLTRMTLAGSGAGAAKSSDRRIHLRRRLGARARAPPTPRRRPTPFDAQTVRNRARELAAAPFKAPDAKLPDALAKLTYDQYRQIRFDPAQALWHGDEPAVRGAVLPPRLAVPQTASTCSRSPTASAQPDRLPAGDVQLRRRRARRRRAISASPASACTRRSTGPTITTRSASSSAPAISAPSPRTRATACPPAASRSRPATRPARNSRSSAPSGSSARSPAPTASSSSALLDSDSCTGAMRFTIRPGEATIFDVECSLFPRVDIAEAGIATGTSMFYFDASDRAGIDDYRRAVHDSDGLHDADRPRRGALAPARQPAQAADQRLHGQQPARLRADPAQAQAERVRGPRSALRDAARACGSSRSATGATASSQLIEIPTKDETHDNIVAFWRPKQVLRAKSEIDFTYRLHWLGLPPQRRELARFVATRCGAAHRRQARACSCSTCAGDNAEERCPRMRTRSPRSPPTRARSATSSPSPTRPSAAGGSASNWCPKDTGIAELRAQLLQRRHAADRDLGLSMDGLSRAPPRSRRCRRQRRSRCRSSRCGARPARTRRPASSPPQHGAAAPARDRRRRRC